MFIELCPHLQAYFSQDTRGFAELMAVDGDVFRDVKGRRTVRFERGGKRYFIKSHPRPSLSEWLKCLLSLKWPVLGAEPEWRGIQALETAGVATMTLAGRGRGAGSFVITEAFENSVSLEELLEQSAALPITLRNRLKRALIPQLGAIARKMHAAGVNHRDFYLCHFLTRDRDWAQWHPSDPISLVVIDLHRVQIRRRPTPARWRIKDLGALAYSAFGSQFTVCDAVRFIRAYHGGDDWKARYRASRPFWFRVTARALGFQREWDRKQMQHALDEMDPA